MRGYIGLDKGRGHGDREKIDVTSVFDVKSAGVVCGWLGCGGDEGKNRIKDGSKFLI